jgi:hypothetical protein
MTMTPMVEISIRWLMIPESGAPRRNHKTGTMLEIRI